MDKIVLNLTLSAFLLVSAVYLKVEAASAPCALREEKYGYVCVCNETYCDYLDDPTPDNENLFVVVSSTKAGLRLDTTNGKFNLFKKHYILDYDIRQAINPTEDKQKVVNTRYVTLDVNRENRNQTIVGFGGSLTGAVSYLLDKLPQAIQDNIYDSFYSERGIGFNMMRMSIGGSDFDLNPWAYNENPINDIDLSNFTELDPRDVKKVEQIKRMKAISQVKNLRIKGAAWSAPPWMKTNNKWTGLGLLKKEYYQTWANYHLRWLELMDANGVPIWAISTGNEPLNGLLFMAFIRFMSLGWSPAKQAIWLNDHLGPTIRNSKYKDLIILGNDDQRYTYPLWFHKMKSVRPHSVDYLDGFAVHWYWDDIFEPSHIDKAHAEMPEKIILSTESCIGDKPWQKAIPLLGSWERGEKYARAFLQDLQHHFNGWIDWNLILDEEGGPNYVQNTVDAPIIINTTTFDEVYKQPMFYTIGHFSKFIPEGSIRIEAIRSNVNVESVAFLRPDNSICVVVLNTGKAQVEITLVDSVRGATVLIVPERSIHTILYK